MCAARGCTDHDVHVAAPLSRLRRQVRPRPGPRTGGADRIRLGDDAVNRLVTIPISHYCEKARWALERAGLGYVEERHVQGVHRIASRRAGGRGTLPVLITPDGVFAESEWIVRYADAHLPPERRLFTGDPEVEALCRRLDAGLGPDARRLMYAHMLPRKALMLPYNNYGVPAWEARAMAALYPVATRWASRELDLTPTTLEDDAPRVRAAFDAIAERLSDGRRHLCGDRFTAADLTFASLAAPLLLPRPYAEAYLPTRIPPDVQALADAYRARPAGRLGLRLYDERGPYP
jgi:glutathione S-transferase